MKKIGNWWCPEDTVLESITTMIIEESFTCKDSLEKAFRYVKHFNKAIDVGTWIGDSTEIIANKFLSVTGFEASNDVFVCCKKNLEEKNVLNCDLKNLGLSNLTGEQFFYNGKSNFSGWVSQKESFQEISISKKILINTAKLDDFNFENIDFIKIDVDSHEGFLLEGAKEFLKKNNPVILIENKERIHKDRQSSTMPNPVTVLESLGYTMVEKVAKADFVFIKKGAI